MNTPQEALITVVLPVFNRADIVGRTLESISRQRLRPLDVVVVDNGSTDATLRVVEAWASMADELLRVSVISEPNRGACHARNAGLKLVGTPYVAFFDSDDEMMPEHLSAVADEILRNPDTDIAYFDVAIVDDGGWVERKTATDTVLMRTHLLNGTLATQRYVVRTELAHAAGGWNAGCEIWDDLELGVRLLMLNPKARRVTTGKPNVIIHPTSESISGAGNFYFPDLRCEVTLDIIEGILSRETNQADGLRWLKAKRAITAANYAREGHREDAARIMRGVLADAPVKDALVYRAVFSAVKLLGHGGAFVATHLLLPGQRG